jgi:hypothetical protein
MQLLQRSSGCSEAAVAANQLMQLMQLLLRCSSCSDAAVAAVYCNAADAVMQLLQ